MILVPSGQPKIFRGAVDAAALDPGTWRKFMSSISVADVDTEQIILIPALAKRWRCTSQTALHRAQQAGLRVIVFNRRVHAVRLSDVIRLEEGLSE